MDAQENRPGFTDIYVVRVNGDWGAIIPRPRHNWVFNADQGVELTEFITDVKADLKELGITPRFHCVQNLGIENTIAKQQTLIKIMENQNDNRGY